MLRSRISHLHPDTNSGKIQKLEELHAAYKPYIQFCLNLLIKDRRVSVALNDLKSYFPRSGTLNTQIECAAQRHAVSVVSSWIASLYARVLKQKITKSNHTEAEKIQLYSIGKYSITNARHLGKRFISQPMVDLYWSWVWDQEICGNMPQIHNRFPMWMSVTTCKFDVNQDSVHFDGWWLRFSCLEQGRRIQLPLSSSPHLRDRSSVSDSVLVRKDRRGRWTFQFTEDREDVPVYGDNGLVSVDVGLNVMAATSDGHLYGEDVKTNFNYLYEKVQRTRANRQRQGLKENSPRLDRLEERLSGVVKTAAGTVANQLILDYPCHTFVLEDLDLRGCKGQKRFAYRAVQKSLESKAAVLKVNPAYTSQQCDSCGYISRQNRSGTQFHCRACGRKAHADVIGARNLLRRSEDKQITIKTPVMLTRKILRERYVVRRRRSSLGSKTAPVSTGRRLTVRKVRLRNTRTVSNLVRQVFKT